MRSSAVEIKYNLVTPYFFIIDADPVYPPFLYSFGETPITLRNSREK